MDRLSGDPQSGFEVGSGASSLEQILRDANVSVLRIVGLATDFCVYATAKSAKEL